MPHTKTFKQVDVDETVQGHIDLVIPLCLKEFHGKFEEPRVHHVYAKHDAHHDWHYWAQIRTGHFGDYQEWTVKFEMKEHKPILEKIDMGYQTYF